MRVQLILEAIDRASRPIRAVSQALLGVERTAKASAGLGRIGDGLMGVGRRAALVGVAAGTAAAGLAASMVDMASAFETMEATLTTTEGSQAKARQAMSWVSDFAAKTPYELQQVGDAFVRLRAYGIDPTNGTLKTLGDASSAMGKPMMQAVEAMADAVTGENERLKEFGIRASVNTKTDAVTYSYMDLAGKVQTVTAKLSDQADIAKKLSAIFDSKFGGAMERQSQTWVGMMSNLSDQWNRFQMMIMSSGLFDWMRSKLQMVLSTLDQMAKDGRLKQWAMQIGEAIKAILVFAWDLGAGITAAIQTVAPYVSKIVELVGGTRNALLLLGGLTVLRPLLMIVQGVGMLVSALVPLGPAFMVAAGAVRAFGIALMANPLGLVITGIAALAAAAYYLYQNWATIGPMLAALWTNIKSAMQAAWDGMIAWLASLGGRITAALASGWASATAWLGTIGTDITSSLAAAWSSVTAWFAGISWPALPAITILDDIKAALEPVIQWIDEWGGRLLSVFEGVFSKVGSFVGGAAETISSAFGKVTGALSSASEYMFGPSAATVAASAADIERVNASAQAATATVNAIPPAAQSAVAQAGQVLASANFHSHGVAMMHTLAEGIRQGATAAVEAARATVQQIRDYLPHSPAKTGPLSDLDRVQFGQTLAGAIDAGAPRALAAARAVAAGLATTLPGNPAMASAQPVASFARPSAAIGGGGVSSSTSVHINLTLSPSVGGAGGEGLAQLKAMLPHIGYELAEAVRIELDRRERTKH